MEIESARLAYVPFKRPPGGHVCIVFKTVSGREIVISPEADVKRGMRFSLLRGMKKTYLLRYYVDTRSRFLERYRSEGREVSEYPIDLSRAQLCKLYEKMLARSHHLKTRSEWYHTLFNSCVTNMANHIDEIRARRRSWLAYGRLVLEPARIGRFE